VFSANCAGSVKPGATPQGKTGFQKQALKARIIGAIALVPGVPLVELDAVLDVNDDRSAGTESRFQRSWFSVP